MNEETAAPIGEALREERERQGLTIEELAQRTKIRARYLRALEAEAWDAFPGHAYAKGFLRTYASELGLDADELADEFRRQVESNLPAGERPYTVRPGPERGRGRASRVLVLLAIPLVIGLVAAGGYAVDRLSGRGDEPPGEVRELEPRGKKKRRGGAGGQSEQPRAGKRFALELEARDNVVLCLVADDKRALIDGQTVRAGRREGPFQGRAFRLDVISGGTVRAYIDGAAVRLASREPARYEIEARGARPVAYPRRARRGDCP